MIKITADKFEMPKLEYLFRGKSLKDNKWIIAHNFITTTIGVFIIPKGGDNVVYHENLNDWNFKTHAEEIDKKTLSQYTGVKDCNGKMVFVGDVVSYDDDRTIGIVVREGGSYMVKTTYDLDECADGYTPLHYLNKYKYEEHFEVVGNIWDTPDKLVKEDDWYDDKRNG